MAEAVGSGPLCSTVIQKQQPLQTSSSVLSHLFRVKVSPRCLSDQLTSTDVLMRKAWLWASASSKIYAHSFLPGLCCDPIVYMTSARLGGDRLGVPAVRNSGKQKQSHSLQGIWALCCNCLQLTPNKGMCQPDQCSLRAQM